MSLAEWLWTAFSVVTLGLGYVVWGFLNRKIEDGDISNTERIHDLKERFESMISNLNVRSLADTVSDHKSKLNDLRTEHDVLNAIVMEHGRQEEKRYDHMMKRMDNMDDKLDLLLDRRIQDRKQ